MAAASASIMVSEWGSSSECNSISHEPFADFSHVIKLLEGQVVEGKMDTVMASLRSFGKHLSVDEKFAAVVLLNKCLFEQSQITFTTIFDGQKYQNDEQAGSDVDFVLVSKNDHKTPLAVLSKGHQVSVPLQNPSASSVSLNVEMWSQNAPDSLMDGVSSTPILGAELLFPIIDGVSLTEHLEYLAIMYACLQYDKQQQEYRLNVIETDMKAMSNNFECEKSLRDLFLHHLNSRKINAETYIQRFTKSISQIIGIIAERKMPWPIVLTASVEQQILEWKEHCKSLGYLSEGVLQCAQALSERQQSGYVASRTQQLAHLLAIKPSPCSSGMIQLKDAMNILALNESMPTAQWVQSDHAMTSPTIKTGRSSNELRCHSAIFDNLEKLAKQQNQSGRKPSAAAERIISGSRGGRRSPYPSPISSAQSSAPSSLKVSPKNI
ncbi:MAG: hypothetical protein ACPGUD_07640 [Parashewanella sp.]